MNEDTAFSCSKCDTNLSSIPLQGIGQSPYVGFWKRFTAAGIDTIILNVLAFVIGISVVILDIFLSFSPSELTLDLFLLFIVFLYYIGFESSEKQATPGKQVVGIKVTDIRGNRISFGRAFFRYVIKFVTALMLGIGYLAIIFSKKKQGLYDMAAGTVVVYK
nr:RDD family protein [uncultured Methanolobus sp.]